MTHQEYVEARALLNELNRQIDIAPGTAKPVFRGIVELHTRVHKYERKHAVSSHPN